MAIKLTWDDLLIQNIRPEDGQRWLSCWDFLVVGKVAPVFMSKFGDWFLRRPDGSTDELLVIDCKLSKVASAPQEFDACVNSMEWQEEHLCSMLVYKLHERGLVPGPTQCYGFQPHPALVGKIDLGSALVIEIGAWQAICATLYLPSD